MALAGFDEKENPRCNVGMAVYKWDAMRREKEPRRS